MVAQATTQPSLADSLETVGHRKDFVRALRALRDSLTIESRRTRSMPTVSGRVWLSCSREDWVRAFGQELVVAEFRDEDGYLVPQAWVHQCVDGRVLCTGYQHGGPLGKSWFVVNALYFY